MVAKLTLDLHDCFNKGRDIDRSLNDVMNEAVEKKIKVVEIIPGKGSGQLKKSVLRFLDQKHIRALYHRVEKDDKNFGRIFVHFRFLLVFVIMTFSPGLARASDEIPPEIIKRADNYAVSQLVAEEGIEYFYKNFRFHSGRIGRNGAGGIEYYDIYYEFLPASRLLTTRDHESYSWVTVRVQLKPRHMISGIVVYKKNRRVVEPKIPEARAMGITAKNGFRPSDGKTFKVSLRSPRLSSPESENSEIKPWQWVIEVWSEATESECLSEQILIIDAVTGVFTAGPQYCWEV